MRGQAFTRALSSLLAQNANTPHESTSDPAAGPRPGDTMAYFAMDIQWVSSRHCWGPPDVFWATANGVQAIREILLPREINHNAARALLGFVSSAHFQ
eukprot:m.32321 g.32321  ORF g.32321 m.32321 type:complete len:98 (-) comp7036_c1_seq1:7382-7675(-)